MDKLIEKFFKSELTEAEEKALARSLEKSEEVAGQFSDRAERAYLSYGLPQPRVPGPWTHFVHSAWGKLMPLVLAVGGITVIYLGTKPVVEQTPPAVISGGVEGTMHTPTIPKVKARVVRPSSPVKWLGAPPREELDTDYHHLRVVVNQEGDGIVTVRVLGPEGNEVRRLYDGPLEEGWWAFIWDGILENGHPASPGVYRIEVGSASGIKSQEVAVNTK